MPEVTTRAPVDLILKLRDAFAIPSFIETGTNLGITSAWAASAFKQVVTIEGSPELFEQTRARYQNLTNIEFVQGNSRTALKEVVAKLASPAIYWLDAHWCDGITFGKGDECPLLDELAALPAGKDHFVLIDDARLFIAPPPRPHDPADWPDISSIVDGLRAAQIDPFICVVKDVIVSVPRRAQQVVTDYAQDLATEAVRREQAIQASPLRMTLRRLRRWTLSLGRS